MNRSRFRKNRARIRREHQLKEQRDRIKGRAARPPEAKPSTPVAFLKDHAVEIVLVVFVAIGIMFIRSLGPDQKAIRASRKAASNLIIDRSFDWGVSYPHGYKVIALSDRDIIHTVYDTFPDDLAIDWKRVGIERVREQQFGSITEKINITFSRIQYPSEGVRDLTVKASLTRTLGSQTNVVRLGTVDLVIKVIEDTGEYVFLLVGLV